MLSLALNYKIMKNRFSLLISATIIFSFLLPTVIPRSYRLQNPERNLLLVNSRANSEDSMRSDSSHTGIIKHFSFIKSTLVGIGDKFISYGYKDLKHPGKVKFRVEEERDTTLNSIINFYITEKFNLNTELSEFITQSFPSNNRFIAATNILTVLSKRTE